MKASWEKELKMVLRDISCDEGDLKSFIHTTIDKELEEFMDDWCSAIHYSELEGEGKLDKRVMVNHYKLAKQALKKSLLKQRGVK